MAKLEENADYIEMREHTRKQRDELRALVEEFAANEEDENKLDAYLKKYCEIDERVKQMLAQINKKLNEESNRPHVTLPRIQIPTFEGGYDTWVVFHDLFQTIIKEDKRIRDSEKMQYLKSYVEGEPSKLIAHLSTTDNNFHSAWEILKSRYQNERLIASCLMNKIYDIPRCGKESLHKLKDLQDVTNECLQAIQNMGIDTWTWSSPIGCMIIRKWDPETNRLYEQSLEQPNEVPQLDEIMEFLKKRFQSLEVLEQSKDKNGHEPYDKKRYQENSNGRKPLVCTFCKKSHLLYYCAAFKELTPVMRQKEMRDRKVCLLCLTHELSEKCNSQIKCKTCGKEHTSLIHIGSAPRREAVTSSHATALVRTRTFMGTNEYLRVLLDSGSEKSFISEEAAEMLGKPREKIMAEVSGIGASTNAVARTKMKAEIFPRFPSEFVMHVDFLALPQVTQTLPSTELDIAVPKSWENKILADPTFNQPGPIDAILGAGELRQVFREGVLCSNEQGLLGQNTTLGWVLSGSVKAAGTHEETIISMISRAEEDEQLTRFWELGELTAERVLTEQEEDCEKQYEETTERGSDGKYTVRIPFESDSVELGESRPRSVARLLQLEERLEKDMDLKKQYHRFLQEYLDLGHMEKVKEAEMREGIYYIPHQPVVREASITTKLRVLFNASCKTTNGKTLNDMMHIGPRLQQELFDILLRWRKHKVVINADIEKMYRQINIANEDQRYQRILWRFDRTKPIEEYSLTTVTYGTASAPYLAVKTLQRLARDEQNNFPEVCKTVMGDFYVDDLLSGAGTVEEAICKGDKIIRMLGKGGLTLRKWSSNRSEVIATLAEDLQDHTVAEIAADNLPKALGVLWAPYDDTFRFKVQKNEDVKCTKRVILSEVAKLFDPLGWIAPVIIKAKLFIQDLWLTNLDWDESVPGQVQQDWMLFYGQFKTLEKIKIPRWVKYNKENIVELHGFSDASGKAYGAAVYVRVIDGQGEITKTLLAAKSKVAPVQAKLTLPRLELCAAVLLAKLLHRVRKALQVTSAAMFAWTDSMIALAWIQGDPVKWKTFVADRVAEIQQYVPVPHWHHVNGKDNPADLVSRGMYPSEIEDRQLWGEGPSWLQNQEIPVCTAKIQTQVELKTQCSTSCVATKKKEDVSITERYSSLTSLLRVFSYCNRFNQRMRKQAAQAGLVTVTEMENALNRVIMVMQQSQFSADYYALKNKNNIQNSSKLISLNPYIDNNGIMRVGGRLENAELPFNAKHPIILPPRHQLTTLIIRDAHMKLLHGGNQLTLLFIRHKFRIVKGKRAVKSELSKCIMCIRHRATTMHQLMGNLPAARVCPSPPFYHTGVDYAGPVQLRTTKGRGHKSYKGYIAVFVCFATKAVHLETVSDMTSEAFLAAFRRFVARRGDCAHMYSDNGTNFVGASNMLEREVAALTSEERLQHELVDLGVTWHFIQAAAPHFGGLWEAGVKSMKHHLKSVIGEATLTFEEMATLLCQIEACLNSRPLCALTEDVGDIQVLTLGHFLIGRSVMSPASVVAEDSNVSFGSRWKVLRKIRNDFWNAWTTEYLHRLQQRPKWQSMQENVKKDDAVILKEHDINPGRWPLARVVEVNPDMGGNVRVVMLQKATSDPIKRDIHQLILLPFHKEGVAMDAEITGKITEA